MPNSCVDGVSTRGRGKTGRACHPILCDRWDMVELKIEGLRLRRGLRQLIARGDARAEHGQAVALVGANGAGKTSLLRCLAGLRPRDAGTIQFTRAGAPVAAAQICHFIGHQDGLKSRLSVTENLRAQAYMFGAVAGAGVSAGPIDLARFDLAFHADSPVGDLSAGQRRRLALARLALGARYVWLLDEPYAALDAAGRGLLDAMATAHLKGGGLIIAATHEPLGFATHGWQLADQKLEEVAL